MSAAQHAALAAPVRRGLVLATCCLSILIVGLDTTILNVALPSIRREFGATVSGAQWTIDAYTLVIACLLVLAGSTADRIGRRRTFAIGLSLFALGSLLCSLAPGLGWLIGFRGLQAVGGSMLNPVALSIITNTFTSPSERARAVGVWGGVVGVAIALGPVLGGVLVDGVGWRAVFWINVPVAALALLATLRWVPESRAARPRRIDPVGQALVAGLLGLLVLAIIEAPAHGWTSAPILLGFAGAAACLAALVPYELHREDPLVDPRFFRSAPFSGAAVVSLCTFVSMGGFLFLNTLYLQEILGDTPVRAGLTLLPMAAMMMVFGPVSGRVVGRFGPRPSMLVGGLATTVAGVVSAVPQGSPSGTRLIAGYLLVGTGLGWLNAAITTTALSGMPRDQAGVAAAITSTTRQAGMALGVAIFGSIIASHAGLAGLDDGAFVTAARECWWIVAGCGAAALLVGVVSTGAWGRATASRTAARLEAPAAPGPA